MATIKDLQSELRALQAQHDAIDVASLEQALTNAQADLAAHVEQAWPDLAGGQLQQGLSAAKQRLSNGRDRQRDLAKLMQPLQNMLDAPARKARAEQDLSALKAQGEQQRSLVAAAAQVVCELQSRHAEALAQLAGDREQTALAILTATKQGKAIKATTPDRGAALALESAVGLAEGEHQAAVDVMTEIQAKIAEAERELQAASEDCARLSFELAMRDFTLAAVDFRKAVPELIGQLTDGIAQRIYGLEATG